MDLHLLGNAYHRHPRAAGLKVGIVTFLFIAASVAPLPATGQTDQAAATEVKRLPGKYDPVTAHLHALKIGTITSSLAYVDEHVAIFSAESGKEPRPIATGRKSVLPLYVISFGIEPASVTSYECADRTDSLYCTFMLKNSAQRASFGLEFWVTDRKISKILKRYNVR